MGFLKTQKSFCPRLSMRQSCPKQEDIETSLLTHPREANLWCWGWKKLWWGDAFFCHPFSPSQAAFVTLDPDTAHASLVVSRDRRGVRWTDAEQDLPPDPRRFDVFCCVLGHWGFTTGRHSWEVEVVAGGTWALGVARNSLSRRGCLEFRPEEGIWAVGRCGNRYRAFASPPTTLPTSGNPRRIRVVLDYEGEQVAFYFAEQLPPVFTFQKACFGGESIFPFFWVGRGSHLRLCP